MLYKSFFASALVAVAVASTSSSKKIQDAMARSEHQGTNNAQVLRTQRLIQTSASVTKAAGGGSSEMHTIEVGEDNIDYPPNQSAASGGTLAQIFSSAKETHGCTTSQDRNKAALDNDFYSVYEGTGLYTDPGFAHGNDALFWESESNLQVAYYSPSIEWLRVSKTFPGVTLFGSNGVGPSDLRQGSLGNCWIMAGASAVAEMPGRVEKIFLNNSNQLSGNGIYGVNLYVLGVPHTILLDDYLPLKYFGTEAKTFFAHIGEDNSVWGPMLEKAFAKLHGNYTHIEGGNPVYSARTMTGAPYVMHFNFNGEYYGFNNITEDDLWAQLVLHDGTNEIIQAGTPGTGNDQMQNEYGIANSHAYSVLGVRELSDGSRLVKMRNPWGRETYHGAYSDENEAWTSDLLDEANHEIGNDGIFFMPVEDYHRQIETTFINMDTTGWFQSYFLMLDDSTPADGQFSSCGRNCSRHKLTLTSEVDQKVWVSAYTWDERCMSYTCNKTSTNGANHVVKVGSGPLTRFWNLNGDLQFDPITMHAGDEVEIIAEWNWSDQSVVAKDWSIVAWGEQGNLSVTHNQGYPTNHLPYIERQEGSVDSGIQEDLQEDIMIEEIHHIERMDSVVEDEQVEHQDELIPEGDARDEDIPDYTRFNTWAESYEPNVAHDCGASIYEEGSLYEDGFRYQTVMVNTCPNSTKKYTVYMNIMDWFKVEHFYTTYEGNQVITDSIIRECHMYEDDAGILACTFELGYIEDYETFGLMEPWQMRAAWQNAAGDYGLLWYESEWLDSPRPVEEAPVAE